MESPDFLRPGGLYGAPASPAQPSQSAPQLAQLLALIKSMAGNYFSGFNHLRSPQSGPSQPTNPITAAAIRAGSGAFGNQPKPQDNTFVGPQRPAPWQGPRQPRMNPLAQAIAMKQPQEGPGVAGMPQAGMQAPPQALPEIPEGPGVAGMTPDPLSSSSLSWGQFGPEQNANAMNGLPAGLGGQPGLSAANHPGKLQALLRAILGGQ